MYDWAHGESDYLEQISHSLFIRIPKIQTSYDWYLDQVYEGKSKEINKEEFARMNVTYMVTSKRKLQRLVTEGVVTGWDDPRMPTISGMRKIGLHSKAIREFIDRVGVAKRENLINIQLLEFCVRKTSTKFLPE